MAFVLVGQVNVLAPVVTINFMLTYIAVDYSYFALSMAHCGLAQSPEPMPRQGPDALHCSEHLLQDKAPSYGSDTPAGSLSEGTLLEFTKDMDQLLQPIGGLESQPRSREVNQVLKSQKHKCKKDAKQTLQDSFLLDAESPLSFSMGASERLSVASCGEQESYQNQQTSRSESHDHLVPDLCTQPRANGEGKSFGMILGFLLWGVHQLLQLPSYYNPGFIIFGNFNIYFKMLKFKCQLNYFQFYPVIHTLANFRKRNFYLCV